MSLRTEIRDPAAAPGFRLHTEIGRGRGALTVLLALPDEPAEALAKALQTLHDPRGPGDLDARLGRLAAEAPEGTAFAVALDRQVWVFPSAQLALSRQRGERTDSLIDPQVLTISAHDRIELTAVGQHDAWASILGSAAPLSSAAAPLAPDASPSTPELGERVTHATVPPRKPPRPHRSRSRSRQGARSTRWIGAAAAFVVIAAAVGYGWTRRGGNEAANAQNGAPELAQSDRERSLERRVTDLMVGRDNSSTSKKPLQESTLPARARIEPEVKAERQEVSPPPAPREVSSWAFRARAPITSSPLVSGDRVVFGSRDSTVYCLDAESGEERWSYAAGAGIGSSPTSAKNRCFIGTYAGKLVALDLKDGRPLWQASTKGRIVSSPCVIDGRVVVGSNDGSVYAFDVKNGTERWRVGTRGRVRASPEIIEPAGILVGSQDGTVYCIDAKKGKIRWKKNVGSGVLAAACFDPVTSRAFVGTSDGTVLALAIADGGLSWRTSLHAEINARPRLAGGRLLVGTGKGKLFALDPNNGKQLWAANAQRGFDAAPLIAGETVVAPSYDGTVHYLALADGAILEQKALKGEIFTSPAADEDRYFLGTLAGTFHAFPLP